MRRRLVEAAILVAALSAGCVQGRKSASGFRLPDGDVHRGEGVFVAQRCNNCHEVAGARLPPPVAEPRVPVVLGGETTRIRTDGELVTAIAHPSQVLAVGYRREAIANGRLSRMGNFNDSMSVQDLVDVVAYLQAQYVVVTPPPAIR